MADVKGGLQARRASMLCQNPRFGRYLDQRRRQANALTPGRMPPLRTFAVGLRVGF